MPRRVDFLRLFPLHGRRDRARDSFGFHHLEQLAGNVLHGPDASRRHVDLARVCLGVGDEFGDGLDRHRGIDLHDIGIAREAGDRRDVADEVETEVVVKRRVDRMG